MSYVIQNFLYLPRNIAFTPKFKFLLIINNLEFFFFFIKFNSFLKFTQKFFTFNRIYLFLFIKYFFSKQYIKLINYSNLNLSGFYVNNFIKSLVHNIFFNIDRFFYKKKSNLNKFVNSDVLVNNLYFYSIKVLNVKINKKLYKNIFFFFLILNTRLWLQYSASLKFYLNFIFINYNLQVYKFYNGYFLKIYNF